MTKLQMEQYGISNPRIIDWRVEADECWKAGIKIYAVQCLNESRATNFYKSIAARTCGAYVQLSDFKIVTDMILAVAFREVSMEKFTSFEKEVQNQGRMDAARKKMFRQISKEIPSSKK